MTDNNEDLQHISSACVKAKQAVEAIGNLQNNDIRNVAAFTATNTASTSSVPSSSPSNAIELLRRFPTYSARGVTATRKRTSTSAFTSSKSRGNKTGRPRQFSTKTCLIEGYSANSIACESDEMLDFLSAFDCKRKVTHSNIVEIVREVAHKEIVQKPKYRICSSPMTLGESPGPFLHESGLLEYSKQTQEWEEVQVSDGEQVLSVPQGQYVKLNFTMRSHYPLPCVWKEYLEIRDGNNQSANVLGVFCGEYKTGLVRSSGRYMSLRFFPHKLYNFTAYYTSRYFNETVLPTMNQVLRTQFVFLNKTSSLWCPVKGAPAPYIIWRKKGVAVQNSTSIRFQLKITSDNNVNYTCEVRSGEEMLRKEISLSTKEYSSSPEQVTTPFKYEAFHVLDEDALYSKLLRPNNSRSGLLSTVTVKKSEVEALLSDVQNIDCVKGKFTEFIVAFEKFKEAHILYMSSIHDETCIARCRESLDHEAVIKDDFVQRVQEWTARAEEVLQLNVQVNPEDSVSEVGSRSAFESPEVSRGFSRSGSRRGSVLHRIGASSLSTAKAREATRVAELRGEAAAFSKRQSFEEQKFRLQQEKRR
ncbi:hypothetical protein AWC38_SpisGene21794 [Stylophora pistillata]|uniref:Ig-like domain-containing protein n=1 Tax=Stylophora pistillata TaxID=50429 RepID=A0A2B4RC41_STYPI|nr:hypothetical protein AWC38_SpisGene21794 [Stylophora pistillata]